MFIYVLGRVIKTKIKEHDRMHINLYESRKRLFVSVLSAFKFDKKSCFKYI